MPATVFLDLLIIKVKITHQIYVCHMQCPEKFLSAKKADPGQLARLKMQTGLRHAESSAIDTENDQSERKSSSAKKRQ